MEINRLTGSIGAKISGVQLADIDDAIKRMAQSQDADFVAQGLGFRVCGLGFGGWGLGFGV